MACQTCRAEIRHDQDRGWVHVDGGGAVLQTCATCGWAAALHPAAVKCPRCGSFDLEDDHTAIPKSGMTT